VSVGHAALVVARAERAAYAADVAAALSMEATAANPSILHPAVGRAKPIPGQVAAADHLRDLLAGSGLLRRGAPRSIQDALSFRVVPQVHGALREYVAVALNAVTLELNASDDNPLVSVPDQTMISNGNFHPMVLAIACDALRIAIAHVGQLSERRMAHLWDAFFRQLTGPPTDVYGLQLRYTAAAVFSELKQLAAPATLDTPPLDLGVEDHLTGAPLSVRKTDAALGLLEDILAIELLLARDLITSAPTQPVLGSGTGAALRMVEEAITVADPRPDAVHRGLRARFPVRLVGGSVTNGRSAAQ
jgi:histidine ammonia-lyase